MDFMTYYLIGIPVFILGYVIIARFEEDITVGGLVFCTIISILPVVREFIFVIFVVALTDSRKVILPRYKRKP